jgi:hypothetical protein
MTLSRQLPGLGASGSALAANSAPVCARGARRSERVLAGWRIFGRNRAPYAEASTAGGRGTQSVQRCRSAADHGSAVRKDLSDG